MRRVLLAGVLALGTTVGTAPALAAPAAASGTTLVWDAFRSPVRPDDAVWICRSDELGLTAGRPVVLQVMLGGEWVTKKSVTPGTYDY